MHGERKVTMDTWDRGDSEWLGTCLAHYPPEVAEKKGLRGSGPVKKGSLKQSPLHCQEIGRSVHRSAAAAPSTHKHFTDTPAVQFGRVGLATAVTHLAETARLQPQPKSAGL